MDKSLKRSFSNVRLDILNIKDYLEKQHDLLNQEISDLQGQILSLEKKLSDKLRTLPDEYESQDSIKRQSKKTNKSLNEINTRLMDIDKSFARINRSISLLESETATMAALDEHKKAAKKQLTQLEKDTDARIQELQEKIEDIRKASDKKLHEKEKQLQESIAEVANLRAEAKSQLRKAKRAAPQKQKPPLFARLWYGIVDFFSEEPVPRTRQEPNFLPVIILLILILLVAAGVWYFSGAIKQNFLNNSVGIEPLDPDLLTIVVNETDFIDIFPNISDPDDDQLNYTFTFPLNKSGQWQTQRGDAGSYPVSVIVSDGENSTEMEFLIVVRPLDK